MGGPLSRRSPFAIYETGPSSGTASTHFYLSLIEDFEHLKRDYIREALQMSKPDANDLRWLLVNLQLPYQGIMIDIQ